MNCSFCKSFIVIMHLTFMILYILLNASVIFFTLSSDKWYVLSVSVNGMSILQIMWILGTQQISSLLGHLNEGEGPLGCINLTATSASSLLIYCTIPIHHCCSYKQHTKSKWKTLISATLVLEMKLCTSAISPSSLHLLVAILLSPKGTNWWKLWVPDIVDAIKNLHDLTEIDSNLIIWIILAVYLILWM